jgi:hypothetical protein
MLRERSRIDNRKLIDLAAAVVDGHILLPSSRSGAEFDGRVRPHRDVVNAPAGST